MKTTWKDIAPVPTSQEFLDIVLSRTQRRLPTQIRAGFKISRIRGVCHFSLEGRANFRWSGMSNHARASDNKQRITDTRKGRNKQ